MGKTQSTKSAVSFGFSLAFISDTFILMFVTFLYNSFTAKSVTF